MSGGGVGWGGVGVSYEQVAAISTFTVRHLLLTVLKVCDESSVRLLLLSARAVVRSQLTGLS